MKLFSPKPPLKFVDQTDTAPEKRSTTFITGIGSYLDQLKSYNPHTTTGEPPLKDKAQEAKEKAAMEAELQRIKKLDEDFENWKPETDPHIKGDPFKTVFIARLSYNISEVDLQKEFNKYGEIERVRIVRDKETGKSKGYAFIVFTNDHSARAAFKEANGLKLGDRNILTDIPRARTMKNWVPRRLGGGLGGRHYLLRYKMKEEFEKKQAEMYGGKSGPSRFAGRGRGRGRGNEFGRRSDRGHDSRGERQERGGYESRGERQERQERDYESRSERGYEPRGERGHSGYEARGARAYESRYERSYESRSEKLYESRTERSSIGYNSRSSQGRYNPRSERSDESRSERERYDRR
jgi:U1 small nuclear ribonucleoprotein